MATIRFESIRKTFGKVVAVNAVTLEIQDGEFMVLLGPSGCGKTTLLRCLAGLEHMDGGRAFIAGRDVSDLPPRDRNIAMVFQSYAVFPHLTVFDNIGFGLKMRGRPRAEIKQRVERAAEMLALTEFLARYPAQLSGGQRQRVAVARALVMEAQVLLMDEPLSNLDALLRLQTRAELKRLHQEIGTTTIYVTHDQVEALSLGQRIAVMKNGQIVQCDTPGKIYDAPASVFVGGFIGAPPMNFMRGTVAAPDGKVIARVAGFDVTPDPAAQARLAACVGRTVLMGVRPENMTVATSAAENALRARVLVVEPLGSHKLVTAQVGAESAKVSVPMDSPVEANQDVWLTFEPHKLRWMDAESGQAI
jgi:multiple sugar transport system ATP-binding protein